MATVGQALTAPETGWKRFVNTNSKFKYNGTWNNNQSNSMYSDGYLHSTNILNDSISFRFYGSKLRIICPLGDEKSVLSGTDIQVEIDGDSSTFNIDSNSLIPIGLAFEKNGLTLGVHTVKITNMVSGKWLSFDAVDIDDFGYLVDESEDLLKITMNDSSEREYKVTSSEVDKFIQWINGTGRTGDNCYKFDDTVDGSKEYLIFEKIISFKVLSV